MKLYQHIPNAITLANLSLASWALSLDHLESQALIILVGMLLDFLDGFSARLLKAQSPIGKELDSLSDMVMFGVLPGLMFFKVLSISSLHQVALLGFLFTLATALRLARFNIEDYKKNYFVGLPSPAAAFWVASLILVFGPSMRAFSYELGNTLFIMGSIVIISFLMISRVRLLALKFKNKSWAENRFRYLLIFVSLLLVLIGNWAGLVWILPAYLGISLLATQFKDK